MVDLHFKITLTKVPSGFPPASCRVAIDADDDGALSDGEYVKNLTQTGYIWTGTYSFPGSDPVDRRVMVGLMGCLHAKYKVEVWRDSTSGNKLVDASGNVSKDPEGFIVWLEDVS